jgi:hypothetical protein
MNNISYRFNRASNYITLFDTTTLPFNNKKRLCYTYSKNNFFYKPHTTYGMVGTTSAAYLGRRRRL